MENKIKLTAILASAMLLQACVSSKSLNVSAARDPFPDNCQATVYSPESDRPKHYETLATVKFGDTGFSVFCGERSVKEAMRVEACKVGANSIIILRQKSPDYFWSTCYRASAELVHVENNP